MKKDNGICEVYAVGFIHKNQYKYYYGDNSLYEFVKYLLSFDKIYNEEKKKYEKIYNVQNPFYIYLYLS